MVQLFKGIIEPPKLATIRKIAEALEVPFDNIVPFDEGLKLSLQEKKEEKTQNSMEVPEQSPEDYRASFINIKNPSNPPRFTVPADDELPAHFRKLTDSIRKSYSLLNAEGKKEAMKQIELADRQIELLTEIPKYRKPDNEE